MTRQDVITMEFEEVSLLRQSEKGSCQCTVRLVYEKSGGKFYVWKSMSGERHIYSVLQECVHACLPKLYDVTIADGTTTVIRDGEAVRKTVPVRCGGSVFCAGISAREGYHSPRY